MGPETRISDAMSKTQMSWLIGIIGGLIAVGTGAKTFWNDWGWITPAQASEAHAGAEQLIIDFRDEWKCDEYEEELRSMKRRLSRIDPDSEEAADLEFDIERIENKMLKLECSRFEDFG
jgi:hypothetical protein